MRGKAMELIVKNLEQQGFDLSKMDALDIFAREGDWQTCVYANKVKSLEAWEVDPDFEKGLRKNLPGARIKITDSIKEVQNKTTVNTFDFVVVDNPQNCYGKDNEYCEHFDVIPDILHFFRKNGILIFNINKKPFDFNPQSPWGVRRSRYYGIEDTSSLEIDWLLNFYEKKFQASGYASVKKFSVSRGDFAHNDYLHYLVYELKKI